MHHAQRQRGVRARTDWQMPVRDARGPCAIWIDDDQLRAMPPRLFDEWPQVNVVAVNVRRPRDDVLRMPELFRLGADFAP